MDMQNLCGLVDRISLAPKVKVQCLCTGLSQALSAPEASALKMSLKDESPPTIREDQPLLTLSSSGSQGSAGQEPGATDHSTHSSSSCGGTSSSSAPVAQASRSSCCARWLSLYAVPQQYAQMLSHILKLCRSC